MSIARSHANALCQERRRRGPLVVGTAGLLLSMNFVLLLLAAPPARATSTTVDFTVSANVASGTFAASVDAQPVWVAPGGSVTIQVQASKATATLSLDLGSTFGTVGIDFDTPIGTISVPVASITVASVNVDVTGSLTSDVSAPRGSLSASSLSWGDWGSQAFTFTADGVAEGQTVNVALDLAYAVGVGASATIPLLGTVTLIPNQNLGFVAGSPQMTIPVRVQSPLPVTLLAVLGLVIGAVLVVALIASRRRKRPNQATSQYATTQYLPVPQPMPAPVAVQPIVPPQTVIATPQAGTSNCPRCGRPLTYVYQYQRWHCPAENVYPWG